MTENTRATKEATDESRATEEAPSLERFTDETHEQVDISDREYSIYRCRDCENVVLSMKDCSGGMICHDETMEEVTECKLEIKPPDIRQVLLDAFGLPKPGLAICLCVIGEGPLPPSKLAEHLDYSESTIRTYLNELVEFGLLEKSQLNRESGGFVNVYHSIDLQEMREESLVGFYAWAGEAASLIEEANLTKEQYRNEQYEDGLNEVFWEQFSSDE